MEEEIEERASCERAIRQWRHVHVQSQQKQQASLCVSLCRSWRGRIQLGVQQQIGEFAEQDMSNNKRLVSV